MSTGNVNSTKRGSGARYDQGKPPVQLLLWRAVADLLPPKNDDRARYAMRELGRFQEDHNTAHLSELLVQLYGSDVARAMNEAARVFAFGAEKYATWNWLRGMDWNVPVACAGRHLLAIYSGEDNDRESKEPHAAHVACNVMMLAAYARLYPEGNTLPVPTEPAQPTADSDSYMELPDLIRGPFRDAAKYYP